MSEFTSGHIMDLQSNQAFIIAASGNEELRQRLIGYTVAIADAEANPDNPVLAMVAEYMGHALLDKEEEHAIHRARMFGGRARKFAYLTSLVNATDRCTTLDVAA